MEEGNKPAPEGRSHLPRAAKAAAMHIVSDAVAQSLPHDPRESGSDEIAFMGDDDDVAPGHGKGRKRRSHGGEPPTKRGRPAGRGGRGRGRRVSGSLAPATHDEDDSSLFSIIKSGKASLSTVIEEWMEEYGRNSENGLLQLLQFFISAAGCKGVITAALVQTNDWASIIRKMTEEFDEDSGDYPLASSTKSTNKFKANFSQFVQELIHKCKERFLYDAMLMDKVIQCLTSAADSQVRAFRHTMTFAAVAICTALVDVAVALANRLDLVSRQYETEVARQQSRRGGNERLEATLDTKTQITDQIEEIRQMYGFLFKSVFVHRYRDVVPEIRSICIVELGEWMARYPQEFLDDSYLKYIGWSLYDKVADVRLKCVKALLPLYDDADKAQRLELFTNKFKGRILKMVLDTDSEVAVHSIKLVTAIWRMADGGLAFASVLEPEDYPCLYESVYHVNRAVALAAGDFLSAKLFVYPADVSQNRHAIRAIHGQFFRDLVNFLLEAEMNDHANYLVDSLIESNEFLKDWEAITELLLMEDSGLSGQQETSLIEIMTCAIRQAATGEIPFGRNVSKRSDKPQGHKELKEAKEEKARMTNNFIAVLPDLVQKYISEAANVRNLMEIPQYFELELYTALRQEKHLESLLKKMEEVVEKQAEEEILETVALTYESLCDENLAIFTRCDTAKSKLIDSIVLKLRENVKQYLEEDADEEDLASFSATIRKLVAFFRIHDLTHYDVWDLVIPLVLPEDDSKEIPNDLRLKSLMYCYIFLVWKFDNLSSKSEELVQGEVERLCKRKTDFLDVCCRLMSTEDDPEMLEPAFCTTCDLLHLFWSLRVKHQEWAELIGGDDDQVNNRLKRFLLDFVLTADERETEDESPLRDYELNFKRRNILASFCKLILFNVIHIKHASLVFQYYLRCHNTYGDIIKHLMTKCREYNKLTYATAVIHALTDYFEEIKEDADGRVLPASSEGWGDLESLAKRLALTFGPMAKHNREAVAAVHRMGILYSLKRKDGARDSDVPENLPFLEVVSEFTNKLLKHDRKAVLNYLNKHVSESAGEGEEWHSLQIYRASLNRGDDESVAPTPQPRGRGRRRVVLTPTPSEIDAGEA